MENPRLLLAKFIDDRIAAAPGEWAPDKREHGQLSSFIERLIKGLGRAVTDEEDHRIRAYAWRIRAGEKPISRKSFPAWVKALRLSPGTPDYERFEDLVDQGRLWGKENGRRAFARLDGTILSLREQLLTQARELEEAEATAKALKTKAEAATAANRDLTFKVETLEAQIQVFHAQIEAIEARAKRPKA
jgi:hypothetical protein